MSSKWNPLDAVAKAWLLPFSGRVPAGPGGFTFGPDNIWQPYTSRRVCLNPLGPQGVDAARPVAPPHIPHLFYILSQAMTCCSWTLARSVPCGLLLIKNSHSWQTAPAVMILWDSSRPFEIPLNSQLFGADPRTLQRILNRNDCFHRQPVLSNIVRCSLN